MRFAEEGLKALVMAALLVAIAALVSRIGSRSGEAQTQYVQDAVKNAALTCYAVEGAYPEDIETLRRNYGLAYDENRYYVSYDAFASNQFPEIFVVEGEGDEE